LVIVDTTVWVDYLRGQANPQTDWLERELPLTRLGMADLILCEVLQGLQNEMELQNVLQRLTDLQVFDTGGAAMAVSTARNYLLLRARGCTVRKRIDCWIATFCIREGFTLLHRDRDYDVFEKHLGLQVIHP
jgi:predicted nucleic acid-binding protein